MGILNARFDPDTKGSPKEGECRNVFVNVLNFEDTTQNEREYSRGPDGGSHPF